MTEVLKYFQWKYCANHKRIYASHTSMIELSAKIVSAFSCHLLSQKNSISDVWQGPKWDKVFKNGTSKICGR